MSVIVKKNEGGNDFKITPDQHVAVCIGVYDIGEGINDYQGVKDIISQVLIRWEVAETIDVEGEWKGKHKCVNKSYTNSLGEKANLRKDLAVWRGRDFTEEELEGFDLEKLIGVPCLLQIGLNKNGYSKVMSINKIPKQMQSFLFTPDNLSDGSSMPEWVHKMCEKRVAEVALFRKQQAMAKSADSDDEDCGVVFSKKGVVEAQEEEEQDSIPF